MHRTDIREVATCVDHTFLKIFLETSPNMEQEWSTNADYASLQNVPIALLLVGEQRTPFYVHQSLLIAASRFFTANLMTGFEETTTQTVTLLEEEDDTIDLFVQWIYHGLRWPLSCLSNVRFMQLARLYAFADRQRIVKLMNDVMWELFSLRSKENFPPFSVIDFTYIHIPEHTRFRELMVAWYTWHDSTSLSDRTPTTEQLEGLPRFAADLARNLMQKSSPGARDPFLDGPDAFYEKAV
jgi:hypothetical protein